MTNRLLAAILGVAFLTVAIPGCGGGDSANPQSSGVAPGASGTLVAPGPPPKAYTGQRLQGRKPPSN